MMKTIETEKDLAEGLNVLIQLEPRFAAVVQTVGPVPLRREPANLASFIRIVLAQQVSVASASAAWSRLQDQLDGSLNDPATFKEEAKIRAAGITRPKVRTIQAVARAVSEEGLDFNEFADWEADAIYERLIAIHGVGPWTVEIFLLFCLGHPDVFPLKDIALQEAVRELFGLEQRPKEEELFKIAQKWSPVRAIAVRLLWTYYEHSKKRENAFPV